MTSKSSQPLSSTCSSKSGLEDAVAVLALTTADLWPGHNWNFVFGQASLGERVGVWSIYRLGDPRTEPATCLLRTLKVAAHETGHMMGIPHCTAYDCGMNGSNHIKENDERPLWFCPEDEMKVWWACRVDPKARYASLVEFGTSTVSTVKPSSGKRRSKRSIPRSRAMPRVALQDPDASSRQATTLRDPNRLDFG